MWQVLCSRIPVLPVAGKFVPRKFVRDNSSMETSYLRKIRPEGKFVPGKFFPMENSHRFFWKVSLKANCLSEYANEQSDSTD
jgi:hypothetical protein